MTALGYNDKIIGAGPMFKPRTNLGNPINKDETVNAYMSGPTRRRKRLKQYIPAGGGD